MTTPVSLADEVNAEIAAFMRARLGRPLWPEEREEYERLLAAWSEAELQTALEGVRDAQGAPAGHDSRSTD